jgi:plastocyanin
MTTAVVAGSVLSSAPAVAGGGCYTGADGSLTQARATADRFGAAIAECSFDPVVIYVDEGASVVWTNKDPFQHTVTGALGAWGSERLLSQGDTVAQTFKRTGVYPFFCMLHPGMVGAVVVGDPDPSEIAATTGSVGNLGIENGSDGGAAAPDARPDSRPASDSSSTSVLVTTIALLAVAAAVFAVVRRRARMEHGI